MCSILGILDLKTDPQALRKRALELSRLQRHRGPDWSGVFADENAILAHERLAIVDVEHGAQPLQSPDGGVILAVNGEIYNHRELARGLAAAYDFQTSSDCEVILALYQERGVDFLNELNGIFSFVLYDSRRNRYVIARDPIGVMPLYTGHDADGNFYVASEMKALVEACKTLEDFPPGHLLDSEEGAPRAYYRPEWREYEAVKSKSFDLDHLRTGLEKAVERQLMTDVPYCVLLSGEGADEIFGGYLYFHKAPNAREFHEETVRKLDQLHKFDCLRANKSMAAWGIEARVPFLDREFLDVAMSFDPANKMTGPERMEKFILRQAFSDLLPKEIVWRQKEQFSDGVGYSWIDSLKEHAEHEVSDDEISRAHFRFPRNTPLSKEAYFYRTIFESHFPGDAAAACVPEGKSIACSTPTALAWEEGFAQMADPSGRAIRGIHQDSY